MTDSFPAIRFNGQLRPSQRDVVKIARRKLPEGRRRLHVVAPPGSGKTVLGLYLWAECIRVPALVLSPNSAIQAQWCARLDLFECPGGFRTLVSSDPQSPRLLTSLTYQAVTLPRRGGKDIDAGAVELWIDRLIEKGQAEDPEEAEVWIEDLKRHNRSYYDDRLSSYRKAARDEIAIGGQALTTLHASALATLERLKQAGVGLLILDECHHLLSHWGRVLADTHRYFDHPMVLGLTATPPEMRGKPPEDVRRYREFFGPVDYEVPVPAVVKDGFLAPYQDLVQFVRPTPDELAYVAGADEQLYELVEQLCRTPPSARVSEPAETDHRGPPVSSETFVQESGSLPDRPQPEEASEGGGGKHACGDSLTAWLSRVLAERRLAARTAPDWATFEKRDPAFARAAPLFLQSRGIALPRGVPRPLLAPDSKTARMGVLVPVLDRYIRHCLRVSSDPADHELAQRATRRLRLLGTQITETGSQACASPIARVLAYARGKAQAILPILKAERRALGNRIRAVVVTDFEKTSAVSTDVRHLLDEEAGGAIAAFRVLLSDAETDALDPALVTGSTVLVDDDLAPRFDTAATAWLADRRLDVELDFTKQHGFHVLSGHGGDWCPRVYVGMVTELFQRGLTKCLVGTRGLLGEGWDASKINVLIDLTTVTTSTSVNQLRGRSLRLDPDDPLKLAHNWDVVCVAPEFVKGLDDYYRFIDKHNTLFGLTDDGAIEKGVGHVHAAFTEIEPEGVEGSMHLLNAEMLQRPHRRAAFRELWRIGEAYHSQPIHALELRAVGGPQAGFPPFGSARAAWTTESLTLAIGRAVLGALHESRLIRAALDLHVGRRAGGYVRAFLQHAGEKDSKLFSQSLQQALGPLDRPRYVIPRHVEYREDTWLSRILPEVIGRYFQHRRRQMEMLHAVPSALAKNKDLAAVYSRYWNAHVSPGRAVYARADEGKQLVERALRTGTAPNVQIHRKEVFT